MAQRRPCNLDSPSPPCVIFIQLLRTTISVCDTAVHHRGAVSASIPLVVPRAKGCNCDLDRGSPMITCRLLCRSSAAPGPVLSSHRHLVQCILHSAGHLVLSTVFLRGACQIALHTSLITSTRFWLLLGAYEETGVQDQIKPLWSRHAGATT